MTRHFAAAALAVVLASAPAAADKIDMSTITCQQFLASGEKDIEVMLVWMHGYLAGQSEYTLLDFAEFEQGSKDLAEYCSQNPETSLMNAVQESMGEEE